jgi:hypothetical protein
MGYLVLDETEWVLDSTSELVARTISMQEMEQIRVWRNSQMSILRQDREISVAEQESYFQESILSDQESPLPVNILFTLWLQGELFGYGGLVHINWPSAQAEISFLIRPEWNNLEIFSTAFLLFQEFLTQLCVRNLGILTLTAESFDIEERLLMMSLLEQSGFNLVDGAQGKYFKGGAEVRSLNFIKDCNWSEESI